MEDEESLQAFFQAEEGEEDRDKESVEKPNGIKEDRERRMKSADNDEVDYNNTEEIDIEWWKPHEGESSGRMCLGLEPHHRCLISLDAAGQKVCVYPPLSVPSPPPPFHSLACGFLPPSCTTINDPSNNSSSLPAEVTAMAVGFNVKTFFPSCFRVSSSSSSSSFPDLPPILVAFTTGAVWQLEWVSAQPMPDSLCVQMDGLGDDYSQHPSFSDGSYVMKHFVSHKMGLVLDMQLQQWEGEEEAATKHLNDLDNSGQIDKHQSSSVKRGSMPQSRFWLALVLYSDGELILWRDTTKESTTCHVSGGYTFSVRGDRLCVLTLERYVHVYRLRPQPQKEFKMQLLRKAVPGQILQCDWHPSEDVLALPGEGDVRLLDVQMQSVTAQLTGGHTKEVNVVRFVHTTDNTNEVDTAESVTKVGAGSEAVYVISSSHDELCIWNYHRKTLVYKLEGVKFDIVSVSWIPLLSAATLHTSDQVSENAMDNQSEGVGIFLTNMKGSVASFSMSNSFLKRLRLPSMAGPTTPTASSSTNAEGSGIRTEEKEGDQGEYEAESSSDSSPEDDDEARRSLNNFFVEEAEEVSEEENQYPMSSNIPKTSHKKEKSKASRGSSERGDRRREERNTAQMATSHQIAGIVAMEVDKAIKLKIDEIHENLEFQVNEKIQIAVQEYKNKLKELENKIKKVDAALALNYVQRPFQPGALEPDDPVKQPWILYWSRFGHISRITDHDKVSIIIQYHKGRVCTHRVTATHNVTIAALSATGYALASTPETDANESAAVVEFVPWEPMGFQERSRWERVLKPPEQVDSLAVGKGFVAFISTLRCLYIFSSGGVLHHVSTTRGLAVTMDAYDSLLLTVTATFTAPTYDPEALTKEYYHECMYVPNFCKADCARSVCLTHGEGVLAVAGNVNIDWLGISSCAVPTVLLSNGQVLGLLCHYSSQSAHQFSLRWVPLLNLASALHGRNRIWPVAARETELEVIRVEGGADVVPDDSVAANSKFLARPRLDEERCAKPLYGYEVDVLPYRIPWVCGGVEYNKYRRHIIADPGIKTEATRDVMGLHHLDEFRHRLRLAELHEDFVDLLVRGIPEEQAGTSRRSRAVSAQQDNVVKLLFKQAKNSNLQRFAADISFHFTNPKTLELAEVSAGQDKRPNNVLKAFMSERVSLICGRQAKTDPFNHGVVPPVPSQDYTSNLLSQSACGLMSATSSSSSGSSSINSSTNSASRRGGSSRSTSQLRTDSSSAAAGWRVVDTGGKVSEASGDGSIVQHATKEGRTKANHSSIFSSFKRADLSSDSAQGLGAVLRGRRDRDGEEIEPQARKKAKEGLLF